MRGDKIFFYPIGIYGNNTVIKIGKTGMCHVKTLGNLRKQFHEEKKMIDYLKMDVEGSEWPSLEAMFKEGFLTKYVKQIGIEYHSYGIKGRAKRFLTILAKLEELGFRKWNMNKSIYIPVLLLVGVLCSTFIVISVVDTNSTIRGFFVAKDNNNVYEQIYDKASSWRKTSTSTNYVDLPKGLYPVREWTPFNLNGAAVSKDPEVAFYKLINKVDYLCLDQMRLGNYNDGGWDICLAGSYKPTRNNCLVYSFGLVLLCSSH
ncbi:hypothetical protein LSH36_970g00084 [Paralvinella palmiformis]|uniref:Methyltransferase FkbM domain-containing protein n=1 Tax=Paralvinella palmiformis TaxID=53620 RepID=A0AAD9IXB6_9ANNE|nr:hypothetical protein LSH36_970g00084 [Paralvinella palmiformis]